MELGLVPYCGFCRGHSHKHSQSSISVLWLTVGLSGMYPRACATAGTLLLDVWQISTAFSWGLRPTARLTSSQCVILPRIPDRGLKQCFWSSCRDIELCLCLSIYLPTCCLLRLQHDALLCSLLCFQHTNTQSLKSTRHLLNPYAELGNTPKTSQISGGTLRKLFREGDTPLLCFHSSVWIQWATGHGFAVLCPRHVIALDRKLGHGLAWTMEW